MFGVRQYLFEVEPYYAFEDLQVAVSGDFDCQGRSLSTHKQVHFDFLSVRVVGVVRVANLIDLGIPAFC